MTSAGPGARSRQVLLNSFNRSKIVELKIKPCKKYGLPFPLAYALLSYWSPQLSRTFLIAKDSFFVRLPIASKRAPTCYSRSAKFFSKSNKIFLGIL